jgi:Hsp20/alpha crystallin family
VKEDIMAKLPHPQAPAVFRALFPGLVDWLESPWAGPPQFTAAQSFRLEEVARDNRHVIRAELPGLDPERDIEVTVEGRTLTIHAERRQEDDEPLARPSPDCGGNGPAPQERRRAVAGTASPAERFCRISPGIGTAAGPPARPTSR